MEEKEYRRKIEEIAKNQVDMIMYDIYVEFERQIVDIIEGGRI